MINTFYINSYFNYNVKFSGGCPGNTATIGKLLEGVDANKVISILKGNDCDMLKLINICVFISKWYPY